jgi:hypothetical protein
MNYTSCWNRDPTDRVVQAEQDNRLVTNAEGSDGLLEGPPALQ